jgi:hypothetical protein
MHTFIAANKVKKIAWITQYMEITELFNRFMVLPSWEANQFSASQEIANILWNKKVYYRVY